MGTYKASLYNYVFNSINAIIIIVNGIVMVPVYFRYMSVSTYGAWLATGNVIAMLGLIESGFSSVITQKMSVTLSNGDVDGFKKLAGANIVVAIVMAAIVFLFGLALSPFVAGWVNVDVVDKNAITLSFVIALISSCIALFTSLICAFPQVWQRTREVGLINTVVNIISIASLILFLLIGCGVASIALSYFVRALLNLFLQGGWVLNYWRINIISKPLVDIDVIRNLIKACLYPFLSRLSGVLMSNSHSFLIAFFINPALAALYDITAKVCTVACTFANMTNGSFFALFSLTIASKDKKRIDSVFNTTTRFFMATLTSILLYCICFTEPIVYYWVGLDKFGGTILLVAIVISNVFQQIRLYCNNIIYTGGLINKSAKLDILCMFVYLGLLVVIIRKAELYAIPIALLVSCALFIIWYLRILSKDLRLDLSKLIGTSVVSVAIAIPFFLAHFLLSPNYHYVLQYVVYFILFTVAFFTALYFTNKDLAKQVKVRLLRP